MNVQRKTEEVAARPNPAKSTDPRARWWIKYEISGNPPDRTAVIRWRRILIVSCVAGLGLYLSLATALWGYYRIHRGIPGVSWIDIAVITRFPRVQAAIGAHYLKEAQGLWAKGDYLRAILTARAAVQKAPENLEACLFLAKCWQDAARFDEAIRTLESAMIYHAQEVRLQKALVELCLVAGRYPELIKLLRVEFPNRGVDLLRSGDRGFQLAEVRAVLENQGGADAEKTVLGHSGLSDATEAAPIMALIDWDLGRKEAAFERLKRASKLSPSDPAILDAYVDFANRLGDVNEAKRISAQFLSLHPNLVPAQLRFLESHDPKLATDRQRWMEECVRCLVQYRRVPAAMQRLGNLAASRGWTDLSFLLYQNSLQENLTGFPYIIFYLSSLLKAGDFQEADAVWRDLSQRNSNQLASVPFLTAMVASGAGRASEASQVVDRIRRETSDKPRERRKMVEIFNQFGFSGLATEMVKEEVEGPVVRSPIAQVPARSP